MTTTTGDLIATTKRHLLSGRREPMNKLNGDITAEGTALTFTYPLGAIQAGAYVQVDLEMVYVWSVAGQVATVERGVLGSTAAAHDDTTTVAVNPSYPDFAILQALNDDLADLSSPSNGLYRVATVDLTYDASQGGYDLTGVTGNVTEIIDVLGEPQSASDNWQAVSGWRLERGVDATLFPSGVALFFTHGWVGGRTLRVRLKQDFSPLPSDLLSDVEATTGLPSQMHDIPPLGAAMRLVTPREIRRNQLESQGPARRPEEVPAGAVANSMRGIASLRQARISAEAMRLQADDPVTTYIPQPSSGYTRTRYRW